MTIHEPKGFVGYYEPRKDSWDETWKKVNKAVDHLSCAFAYMAGAVESAINAIVPQVQNVMDWVWLHRDLICLDEAINLGLVPARVEKLYLGKNKRVAKKNKNRVRRELVLYIKRNPEFGESLAAKVMAFPGKG